VQVQYIVTPCVRLAASLLLLCVGRRLDRQGLALAAEDVLAALALVEGLAGDDAVDFWRVSACFSACQGTARGARRGASGGVLLLAGTATCSVGRVHCTVSRAALVVEVREV
jgi:hypothetical protein